LRRPQSSCAREPTHDDDSCARVLRARSSGRADGGGYKYYGDFAALTEIDLKVAKGEKIVICGPSGSGKSTLIRCINHIEKHDDSLIYVNGVELDKKPENIDTIRRDTGMVFQSFNLFPHMTILENCILAPMTVHRMSKREVTDLAMHFLNKVRIPDQASKFPGQLSGGQQQRVAIARALCMRPKIMLFQQMYLEH
jgi:ABC-type polar amino acid transport system ATPase subunit